MLDCFFRDLKQLPSRKMQNKRPNRETKEYPLFTQTHISHPFSQEINFFPPLFSKNMLKFLFFLLYLFLTFPPFSTALFFYIQVKILRYPHGTLHNSFSSRTVPIVLSATCRWNLITHRTKHWLRFPPAPIFLLAFS